MLLLLCEFTGKQFCLMEMCKNMCLCLKKCVVFALTLHFWAAQTQKHLNTNTRFYKTLFDVALFALHQTGKIKQLIKWVFIETTGVCDVMTLHLLGLAMMS